MYFLLGFFFLWLKKSSCRKYKPQLNFKTVLYKPIFISPLFFSSLNFYLRWVEIHLGCTNSDGNKDMKIMGLFLKKHNRKKNPFYDHEDGINLRCLLLGNYIFNFSFHQILSIQCSVRGRGQKWRTLTLWDGRQNPVAFRDFYIRESEWHRAYNFWWRVMGIAVLDRLIEITCSKPLFCSQGKGDKKGPMSKVT